MTYPSGRVYTYAYNNAGEIASLVDAIHGINFFTGGQYAPPGLLTGGVHGAATGWNAITLANTYNNRLQPTRFLVTSPVPSTLLDLTYSYDQGSGKNNGSVVQIDNGRDSTRSVQYTYDQLNRLGSAKTYSAVTWGDSYTYDAWGNLLQKNVIQGTAENLTLTVNNKNQVATFTYDPDGNVTSDGSVTMTYDAEGRMITASGGTFNDTYIYDGDGRRVKKSDGTFYWVDDSFRPISIGTSTSLTKDFVFLAVILSEVLFIVITRNKALARALAHPMPTSAEEWAAEGGTTLLFKTQAEAEEEEDRLARTPAGRLRRAGAQHWKKLGQLCRCFLQERFSLEPSSILGW